MGIVMKHITSLVKQSRPAQIGQFTRWQLTPTPFFQFSRSFSTKVESPLIDPDFLNKAHNEIARIREDIILDPSLEFMSELKATAKKVEKDLAETKARQEKLTLIDNTLYKIASNLPLTNKGDAAYVFRPNILDKLEARINIVEAVLAGKEGGNDPKSFVRELTHLSSGNEVAKGK